MLNCLWYPSPSKQVREKRPGSWNPPWTVLVTVCMSDSQNIFAASPSVGSAKWACWDTRRAMLRWPVCRIVPSWRTWRGGATGRWCLSRSTETSRTSCRSMAECTPSTPMVRQHHSFSVGIKACLEVATLNLTTTTKRRKNELKLKLENFILQGL